MCAAHCSWRTRMCLSWGNSGSTSYNGMIAPPGRPKIVVTPSSTSDWHIALAPFKRIDVLTFGLSAPLRLQLPDLLFRGTKNPALFTEARSCPAVPPCLVLSAVYRPPPRRGLLDHWNVVVLPHSSKASSGTCLHRSFTNRRLSEAEPQLRTTPRHHLENIQLLRGTLHGQTALAQVPTRYRGDDEAQQRSDPDDPRRQLATPEGSARPDAQHAERPRRRNRACRSCPRRGE